MYLCMTALDSSVYRGSSSQVSLPEETYSHYLVPEQKDKICVSTTCTSSKIKVPA